MWFGLRSRLDPYINTILGLFHKDTWQELEECDVLLVRHHSYTVFRGKKYHRLIDSIGYYCHRCGLNVSAVATHGSRYIKEPVCYNPVYYNRSFGIISFYYLLINKIMSYEYANNWKMEKMVDLWLEILDKAKPNIVIGIQPENFLCMACRRMNIPVYDLQHGVISDDHSWYGEKHRIDTPTEMLPTGFLCWDDQSVATLSRWAVQKGIRVVKIGNPWFLRFMKADPDDELVQEAILTSGIQTRSKPTILISLQWGMKDHFQDVPNGIMVDALETVILDTFNTYNWVLRLHPVQQRVKNELNLVTSYLKATFGEERAKQWIEDSNLPLPLILRDTNLHITYGSTIVIEAAWRGIRSGILNPQINDAGTLGSYYAHERSLGIAEVLPHDPDIIKQWINDTLSKGRAESTLDTTGEELGVFIDEICTSSYCD